MRSHPKKNGILFTRGGMGFYQGIISWGIVLQNGIIPLANSISCCKF